MFSRFTILILLLLAVVSVDAQSVLTGVVWSEDSIPVANITIFNKVSGLSAVSNEQGYFSLEAERGDTILFKALGFTPLLYLVKKEKIGLTFKLKREPIVLNAINIIQYNYHKDSLKFRQEYEKEFNFRRPKFTDVVPMIGLGFTVNINQLYKAVSFKKNKKKDDFRKLLIAKEKENTVLRVFTPELVTQLTGLQGDSLSLFMTRYQPSYEFIKDASTYDVWNYIKQFYKKYSEAL